MPKNGFPKELIQKPSLNSNPMASIIISNYNGEKFLNECLSALMKLDYSLYEIIVVDAGSSDNSVAIIERDFPKVRLIKKGKMGVGEAINCGIFAAKGEIIIVELNNDDIVDKKWLNRLIRVLVTSPDIGIVVGKRFRYGSNRILDSTGGSINFLTGNNRQIGHNCLSNEEHDVQKEVDTAEVIATRREVFKKVGLFDPFYYIYYEDTDFCLRVKRSGYKIVFEPSAIFWHKGSATIGQQSRMSYYYMYRNQIRFILKNYPIRYMIFALSNILFFQNILELHMLVPPFGKRISKFTPLLKNCSWAAWGKDDLMLIKVRTAGILWNIKNLRNTVIARYQTAH